MSLKILNALGKAMSDRQPPSRQDAPQPAEDQTTEGMADNHEDPQDPEEAAEADPIAAIETTISHLQMQLEKLKGM